MAKSQQTFKRQNYPRIQDDSSPNFDLLDDSALKPHSDRLSTDEVKDAIRRSIHEANLKSKRSVLADYDYSALSEKQRAFKISKAGSDLLKYFQRYSPDPAETAHEVRGKHYTEVGRDLFHRRAIQKGRMNSGWRYQFLAANCAQKLDRFSSVSSLGSVSGADFTAVIPIIERNEPLNIFVSVKNRKNTIGGQDFPKASETLEKAARDEKNKVGPYLCVFGIAMERGRTARSRRRNKDGHYFSENTEVWLSNYFWPFFTNYSYQEIMLLVLDVLEAVESEIELPTSIDVPDVILESFGDKCRNAALVNSDGIFNEPRLIVNFIAESYSDDAP